MQQLINYNNGTYLNTIINQSQICAARHKHCNYHMHYYKSVHKKANSQIPLSLARPICRTPPSPVNALPSRYHTISSNTSMCLRFVYYDIMRKTRVRCAGAQFRLNTSTVNIFTVRQRRRGIEGKHCPT